MLVLSRRLNEKVVMPGLKVTVQVVAIDNGRVRLGFEAPPDVTILREELTALLPAPARARRGAR
jgi:carbon storage regulator